MAEEQNEVNNCYSLIVVTDEELNKLTEDEKRALIKLKVRHSVLALIDTMTSQSLSPVGGILVAEDYQKGIYVATVYQAVHQATEDEKLTFLKVRQMLLALTDAITNQINPNKVKLEETEE